MIASRTFRPTRALPYAAVAVSRFLHASWSFQPRIRSFLREHFVAHT